jgi:hypothetical protein
MSCPPTPHFVRNWPLILLQIRQESHGAPTTMPQTNLSVPHARSETIGRPCDEQASPRLACVLLGLCHRLRPGGHTSSSMHLHRCGGKATVSAREQSRDINSSLRARTEGVSPLHRIRADCTALPPPRLWPSPRPAPALRLPQNDRHTALILRAGRPESELAPSSLTALYAPAHGVGTLDRLSPAKTPAVVRRPLKRCERSGRGCAMPQPVWKRERP